MRTIQDGERRFRNIFKVFYADFTCGECGAQFNCQNGEFIYNKDYIESGHKYIYLVCPYCHKYHHNYTYNLEPTPSVGWVVRSKVVNFHHEINISAWDELTGGQQDGSMALRIIPGSTTVKNNVTSVSFDIVTTDASVSWIISESSSWITLPVNYGTGSATVTVNLQTNTSQTNDRTGVITVFYIEYSKQFTVKQLSVEHSDDTIPLTVSPTLINTADGSNNQTFTVTCTAAWSATSNVTWCVISEVTSTSFKAAWNQNTSGGSRTALITVKGTTQATQVVTVTINQAAGSSGGDSLTLSPTSLSFIAAGEDKTISITASGSWTATSDHSDWCPITAPASGSGNGTIHIVPTANTGEQRTATITVVCGSVTKTVSVAQAAGSATGDTLSIDLTSINIDASGGERIINVTSNINWTVISTATTVCTVNPSSGSNNGQVTVTIPANTTENIRNASIVFSKTGGSTMATCSVSQAAQGSTGSLSISPESLTFYAPASEHNVSITSDGAWTVGIPASANWLSVDYESGTGNKTIEVSAVPNSTYDNRQTDVTITAGSESKTLHVLQYKNIVWNVSVDTLTVASGGGSTTFDVQSHSGSNTYKYSVFLPDAQTWVSINPSGTEVRGDQTITVTVEPNTDSDSRSAIIRLWSQVGYPQTLEVNLTQAAQGASSITLSPTVWNVEAGSGTTYQNSITVTAPAGWTASIPSLPGASDDWCYCTKISETDLRINVRTNTGEARSCEVVVTAGSETASVTVSQASASGQEATYAAKFIHNTSLYPTSDIVATLSTTGMFCKIWLSNDDTVLNMLRSDSTTSTNFTLSSTEQEQNFVLGANNCIIFGNSNFDGLKAYDGQCRNCVISNDNHVSSEYELTLNANGTATCPHCNRIYDLNTGVLMNGEDGDYPLVRYSSSFNGQIFVIQSGTPVTYTLSTDPSELNNVPASGYSYSLAVTSNITWHVVSSNTDICTVTPASGTNDGTVTVNVNPNTATSTRSTTIVFSSVNLENDVVVNVNQAASGEQPSNYYTVGLISDIHYCITKDNRELISSDWGNNSASGSYFADDLRYILVDTFNNYYNVDFVASPGDIATQDINDFIKFTEDYNISKPFYCAMGNHDHLITYGVNAWTQPNQGPDGSRWTAVTGTNTSGTQGSWNCPGSLAGSIPSSQKSNLSYYITKGTKDIYVFLQPNYGSNENTSLKQTHPHNQLPNPSNNTYVQQMVNYAGVNTFSGNESNFNFQYYLPEDLIWLKGILESNTTKRIFIFSHYFFPHKAGGGNKYVPGASTELMGITFHFLNKLNNTHKNTIWFSGHSHISWRDASTKGLHWTNTNYDYIKPLAADNSTILTNYTSNYYKVTTGNKPYNRNSAELADTNKTGWNVHLPSMSRPVASGSNQMPDCEAAIMTVYDDHVEIKKLGYTRNSDGSYTSYGSSITDRTLTINSDGSGTNNDTAPEIDEGSSSDGIKFILNNNCGKEVRLSGKIILNLSRDPNDWTNSTQANANMHGPQVSGSFAYNDIIIPVGGSYTANISVIDNVYPDYAGTDFTDGTWYFMNADSSEFVHTVYIYSRIWRVSRNETTGSNHIYVANPLSNTILQNNRTYTFNITWFNPEASLAPNTTTDSGVAAKYYVLQENQQTWP